MNIPKEKLIKIGLSIKVNRTAKLKESKSGKWNQKNFAEGICSQNTLSKLEHGQVSRFIEVYESLAERLGLKFGYFPEVEDQIKKITPKLYKAVEFYAIKKILFYSERLLSVLEPVKECLWYCDLNDLIYAVINFYESETPIDVDHIDKYIDMSEGEFGKSFQTILKTVAFSSVCVNLSNKKITISDMDRVYDALDLENGKSASNIINALLYCLTVEKTTEFLKQVQKLEIICRKTDNLIRLLDGYSLAITYLCVMDRHEVESYILKFEDLLKTVESPLPRMKDYLFSLGTASYERGMYQKSLEYLKKASKLDTNKNNIYFIYIASAQRKLKLPIDIPYYSEKELKALPDDLEYIYKYYKFNDSLPAFVKQRFIMEKVLPRLSEKDEVVINIIKEELLYLIETSNHYKDAVLFEMKCRELLDR